MAKNVGFVGGLRGKLGNAVFYITNGVQVARVYQPVVANPNTQMQIAQRAKMSLAGRLSKITPVVALSGLGGSNKRIRRGTFVKEMISASTYNNNKASLIWSNLHLSRGNVQAVTNCQVARTNNNSYIQLNITTNRNAASVSLPSGYGLRAVIYFIDSTNSGSDFCRTILLNLPTNETTAVTSFSTLIARGTAANFSVVTYVIPFLATENLDGVNYSFVGDEQETYIVIDSLKSVAKLEYGESSLAPVSTSAKVDELEDKKRMKN